ncbi:dol-P-Man:Man(5)GlcNAc(2)-PP-Dol alpha-1,3-mannosyltransferase-like [Watersipora subatra]|uniref:dol-P-Man:Man(5)GlcNAc(2)-PP-Dol alpha-1,3-mannosyltransferase-like n=1 Tax=Watersipora subatra TaxID=2589382 RepID=UPI00355C35C0
MTLRGTVMPQLKRTNRNISSRKKEDDSSWSKAMKSAYAAIFDPTQATVAMVLLLLAEAFLNVFIIRAVKYTEIDWVAYMQEVEGVINGTYDYTLLKGDTGPLVYPGGFVCVYTVLYYLTDLGTNIRLAQYIYMFFYLLTIILVFNIYRKVCKLPPWALVFICAISYRVHSIYVLRLFNDPVAMIFLYSAVNCFLYDRWLAGCVLYSLGVSVKMNILLFAPGLLVLLLKRHNLSTTFLLLSVCALIQVSLGAPFLIENPVGYIMGAFNLGRQFLFKWTVNWRFLSEEIFGSRYFHVSLLAGHLTTLWIFYQARWREIFNFSNIFNSKKKEGVISANDIVRTLFVSNFIGICFSRSLHYQFYVWYFHTLHYLVWDINLPSIYKMLILGTIEMCWNTYPSTVVSSAALHCCHLVILLGLLMSGREPTPETKKE